MRMQKSELGKLIRKYSGPGPRYTSYPTAPQFTPEVDAAEYAAHLREIPRWADLSLYVHVPFCEKRCTYCGCFVVPTARHDAGARYLDALERELELVRSHLNAAPRVGAVHLGGGTPTWLSAGELRRLFGAIRERFELAEDAELSIEIDPRVTAHEQLETLRALGVRRVSLGVQDTSELVQEAIGRHQSLEETRACFRSSRELFENVNLDLVYGLPSQRLETLTATLQEIVALGPDRLALYGYAHVPWIQPHQQDIPAESLPSPADRAELFLLAHERLSDAGYVHIGMDHFARPDDPLALAGSAGTLRRNFMGYTARPEPLMLGLGVSSIGDTGRGYFQNEKKLARWYDAVENDRLPIERGLELDEDDIIRRAVIQDILCAMALDVPQVEARHDVDFGEYFAEELERLEALENDGLVGVKRTDGAPSRIEITETGRLLARSVAMVFDRYLRAERGTTRYSQTV